MTGENQASSVYSGNWVPSPADVAVQLRQLRADLQPRYEPTDYVGRGGFATVWRARDVLNRREVAIKRFERTGPRGGSFYRELSVLFRFRHPRIVQPINLLETPANVRYLILEYCSGGSLRVHLSRARRAGTPVAPWWVWEVAEQTAEALLAAHQQGIVHRDVKPENILFARPFDDNSEKANVQVKLADFGLARLLQEERSDALARLSGSPAYMAPEQFSGNYLPSSDLYSLGVILAEMLSGQSLFVGTAEQLAYHHLRTEPDLTGCPDPWARLLAPLLSKDVNRRPSLPNWLEEVRLARPHPRPADRDPEPRKARRKVTVNDDQLDEEMDLLQPALTALAALRRGKCPPIEERSLLEQQSGPGYQAHTGLLGVVQWDEEPARTVKPTPSRSAPTRPTEPEPPAVVDFFGEGASEQQEEQEEGLADDSVRGSVADVLTGLDWR